MTLHIERFLRPGDRFGGHRVLAHAWTTSDARAYFCQGAKGPLSLLKMERWPAGAAGDLLVEAASWIGAQAPETSLVRAEAAALRACRHRAIPIVEDAGEIDGHAVAVVPWFGGARPLHQALDLPPWKRVAILADAWSALMALHRAGVVHRDLKLSNVLASTALLRLREPPAGPGAWPGPACHVIDFELALVRGRGVSGRTGTSAYQAPERRAWPLGGGPEGPETDLYAFGVTAAALLLGERPTAPAFDGPRFGGEPLTHVPEWVHPALAGAVRGLLTADPALRRDAADGVGAALAMQLAAMGASALAPPAVTPGAPAERDESVALVSLPPEGALVQALLRRDLDAAVAEAERAVDAHSPDALSALFWTLQGLAREAAWAQAGQSDVDVATIDAAVARVRGLRARLRGEPGPVASAASAPTPEAVGAAALERGDWRTAATEAHARLEAEPEDAQAWRVLGEAWLVGGDAALAEEAATRAIALAPFDPAPWVVALSARLGRGVPIDPDFDAAARSQHGAHPVVLELLARNRLSLGHLEAARELSATAIRNGSNDWDLAARAHRACGDLPETATYARAASRRDPTFRVMLAEALIELDHPREALSVPGREETDADLFEVMLVAARALGRVPEATDLARRLLQSDPRRRLGAVVLVEAAVLFERPSEALALAPAIPDETLEPVTRLLVALAQRQGGHIEASQATAGAWLAENESRLRPIASMLEIGDSPEARLHVGAACALLDAGRIAEAMLVAAQLEALVPEGARNRYWTAVGRWIQSTGGLLPSVSRKAPQPGALTLASLQASQFDALIREIEWKFGG